MAMDTAKRITIFTGHYGSGKTEISINFTLNFDGDYDKIALVDLDFVNPYFRSREAKTMLTREGIRVIASAEDYFNTDVPAFSPQIIGVFRDKETRVIVDLGGDEIGARAAGRFRNHIADTDYELLFVINPYRPFTKDTEDIAELIKKIEMASRLKVTALVSNPNLAAETTIDDIISGHQRVLEISCSLGVPVAWLTVEKSFGNFSEIPKAAQIKEPVLELARIMLTPWEQ